MITRWNCYRAVTADLVAGTFRPLALAALITATAVSPGLAQDKGVLDEGTLTVAATASFPPIVSVDTNGAYVGIDADIVEAIAKQAGLKIKWVNIKFDSIIPGISAKRFDVGMTGITDTVEREKVIDFVNYANVGSGIIVQAGNPKGVSKLDDICGLIVASQTGDVATTYANTQSKKCVADGRKPVVVNEFPEATQSMLQLQNGRADIIIHDYPLSAYQVQHSGGKLQLAGGQFSEAPYGMAIYKGNTVLRETLMSGLDAIIANGEYRKILDKYGVAEIGIEKATYNAASK